MRWSKYWSFSFSIIPSKEIPGLISFRMDWLDLLATIRSGAAAGATAVQPSEMTSALAGKQDVISDLPTIRSGAAAGATAVQPSEMTSALAGKQVFRSFAYF